MRAKQEGGGMVPVYESGLIAAPMTIGVISAKIMLPTAWTLWPEEKLRAVLAHELAHVRRRGGRFPLQRVGVDGSGLLGQRIDRILRGDFFREVSRTRKAVVAVSGAVAIFIIVACHQQGKPPVPLQENPNITADQAQLKAENDLQKAAWNLEPEGATNLEASLRKNPEDLVARRVLLRFYAQRGSRLLGGEKALASRRQHILWLIEHHPESEVTGSWEARIDASDAVGNEQARKLWLAQTARPDASPAVLGNAAGFFERSDPRTAERLLLGAQAMDPKGAWSLRLGKLYASVLLRAGSVKPASTNTPDPSEFFAQEIRKKLAQSKDAGLLAEVGANMPGRMGFVSMSGARPATLPQVRVDVRSTLVDEARLHLTPNALGKSYLEQALKLDPQSIQAHSIFVRSHVLERNAQMRQALRDVPGELTYEAVSTLPENDGFSSLTQLAETAYLDGERINYNRHDSTGAAVAGAAWNLARKYAEDELSLAPKFRKDLDYGTAIFKANIVLGTVALRQGDKKSAVRYMLEASKAPVSEELAYSTWPPLTPKLLGYLLKCGERESVIEFLERFAQINVIERPSLLEAADQIRKGIQPSWYPREESKAVQR